MKIKKSEFKAALKEASKWAFNLTERQRARMSYNDARKQVVKAVYEKYKPVKPKATHE